MCHSNRSEQSVTIQYLAWHNNQLFNIHKTTKRVLSVSVVLVSAVVSVVLVLEALVLVV